MEQVKATSTTHTKFKILVWGCQEKGENAPKIGKMSLEMGNVKLYLVITTKI